MIRPEVIVRQLFEPIATNAHAAAGFEAVEIRQRREGQLQRLACDVQHELVHIGIGVADFSTHVELETFAHEVTASRRHVELCEFDGGAERIVRMEYPGSITSAGSFETLALNVDHFVVIAY